MHLRPGVFWSIGMEGLNLPDDTPTECLLDDLRAAMIDRLAAVPKGKWPEHWHGLSGDRDFDAYLERHTGPGRSSTMRRLPDGSLTENTEAYAAAWREYASPIEEVYGWALQSCDPGMTFLVPDALHGRVVFVPGVACAGLRLAATELLELRKTTNRSETAPNRPRSPRG